tara:strand:+ start:2087 stop:3211 length:1125 start_codon:yes stop_codon:yes gene_type:complete
MADYEKVNDVAASSIEKINDIAKSSIEKINGMTTPSGTTVATVWSGIHLDREITYATSDLTSWSSYDAYAGASGTTPGAGTDPYHMAYGKDGSGNPRWVISLNHATHELQYTDDPSNENNHTLVTTLSDGSDIALKAYVIHWGNNVWMAAGTTGDTLIRSTDGASWAEVDVSGATSINASKAIYALISDGAGTWWFAQENRIYKSTNDGAAFSLHHTLLDAGGSDPGDIRGFAYTNNTLVALCKNTGDMFAAASSDTTDWSSETTLTGVSNFGQQTRIAAAGGRVVIAYNAKYWAADVSGKTITLEHNNADLHADAHGNARCCATDGTTWVVGCNDGDVLTSTDTGDNWTISATNVAGSNFEMVDVAGNVYLPL